MEINAVVSTLKATQIYDFLQLRDNKVCFCRSGARCVFRRRMELVDRCITCISALKHALLRRLELVKPPRQTRLT